MNSVSLRRSPLSFMTRMLALVLAVFAIGTANVWAQDAIRDALKKTTSAPTSNEDEYLKPDEAFKFSASMNSPDKITLNWVIAPEYYLYRDRVKVVLDGESQLVQLGTPEFPDGKIHEDEYFGKQVVYYTTLQATVPVARAANAKGDFKLKVTYQGCADAGLCYNPQNKFVTLALPSTDKASTLPSTLMGQQAGSSSGGEMVSEQDRLANALQGDNLAYALMLFFVAGLALSLTPCVLPMIPILSGIIAGQGDNITRMRSFSLALTYTQGMALTYAAAGAIFVLAFKQAPQAFFQQAWIIILMTVLFIALAFAMFGAYTLQMPSFIQSKLTDVSNNQKSGTFIGTFVMGALSALVVTACVAPAIIGALSVISQSRQVFRGALALYATGVGMGVPLLIVGASAGSLLPKAGAWMDTVKQMFGVVFIGVAIYLLQPLLPGIVAMMLWAALAIVSGYWIFALTHGAQKAPSVVRGFGVILLVYGSALLLGALAGRTDPLQPLAGVGVASSVGGGPMASAAEHALPFKRIKSLADLDRELAAAKSAGKPVMLDFYADWCVSCKEMEKYTFTDPRVTAALANAVLLQSDVTANDDDDQALLNRFGIFGPPSIMFFPTTGDERRNYRVVGYMKADKFHEHVASAFTT
ncbi:MAG TPA: protein-disulfide reductase DsbD [Steroidobacteraceae bacterium]|nr:protein-disulfide reductase DsbD [Steroidobacteraceae bacterium]